MGFFHSKIFLGYWDLWNFVNLSFIVLVEIYNGLDFIIEKDI